MKTIYWFCSTLWKKCFIAFFSYRVVGREKLITDGPVILASNHESFLDPPLVGVVHDEEVYYLARKTLFTGFGAWLYPRLNSIPVDQERPDMTSLKTVIKVLKQGEKIVIFPEGSRTLDGKIGKGEPGTGPVSYTHLTLPTIYSV